MGSMQVVFLFDLNACADFLLKPKEELSKGLLSIRLACLRLLSDFSAKSPNFKWGFKFFDSRGSKFQTMCKYAFSDISLENFETLENEICVRYERHLSILQALMESSEKNAASVSDNSENEVNDCSPVNVLHFALTQILCEFQWETMDMWSPSATKIKKNKRNFLFIFCDFKDNDEFLFNYFGQNISLTKSKFINAFLPQPLRDSILKKADIHLVLLNMCQNQKFMGSFSSKILPLLSGSLHSIQGSLIPLIILAQPLYNMSLLGDLEKTMSDKDSVVLNMPNGYHNSFIPFSTLFAQSLYHPFYSTANTSVHKFCIDFPSKDLHMPIQIMEIPDKKSSLCGDVHLKTTSSTKHKSSEDYFMWSKFNAHCAVPRSFHFPSYKIILCLPNQNELSTSETCILQDLNKSLNVAELNLLLECVTENGLHVPGLLIPMAKDAAVICILHPSINFVQFESDCNISTNNSLNNGNLKSNCSDELHNFYGIKTTLCDNNKQTENIPSSSLKSFQMECLESWYKPRKLCNATSFIESKFQKNPMKMDGLWKLLKQSVKNSNHLKSKHLKRHLSYETESNSADPNEIPKEKLPDDQSNSKSDIKEMEELPSDLNLEELLSALKDEYDSAIGPSGNIITASRRIMKMMITYSKKHTDNLFEEEVNTIFKDSIFMNDRSIIKKYEMFDSAEVIEKKIKECQIQILLNLEVESLKACPDKSNCVNTITSLLRLATFCYSQKELLQLEGLKELKTFLNDVLKKNYSHTLYDILVEIGEECIQIFDDSESENSPIETTSSEFNNDDELFSSVTSSIMSEKSSSSTGSRKEYKDNKDKDTLERKLLRRRSDISDSSRYRQVLLPKSSPKKKKSKVAASKAVRYSPRIAAKRNEEHAKSISERPKVRRNLFSGDKVCRTPKKIINEPSTPNSKRRNFPVSKTKLAAETPSHKQNYSALQRRKSFIDHLSNSPKVIAESPTIIKTAKDGINKELFEKLEKCSQEALKPTSQEEEQKVAPSNFKDFTPESKRRLSLKLFSKLLISPTARQGIKKCTKRLFDQLSPLKTVESSKKHKPDDECNLSSNSPKKSDIRS